MLLLGCGDDLRGSPDGTVLDASLLEDAASDAVEAADANTAEDAALRTDAAVDG